MTVAELRDLKAVVIFLPKSASTILLLFVFTVSNNQYCSDFSGALKDVQLNIAPHVDLTLNHIVFQCSSYMVLTEKK